MWTMCSPHVVGLWDFAHPSTGAEPLVLRRFQPFPLTPLYPIYVKKSLSAIPYTWTCSGFIWNRSNPLKYRCFRGFATSQVRGFSHKATTWVEIKFLTMISRVFFPIWWMSLNQGVHFPAWTPCSFWSWTLCSSVLNTVFSRFWWNLAYEHGVHWVMKPSGQMGFKRLEVYTSTSIPIMMILPSTMIIITIRKPSILSEEIGDQSAFLWCRFWRFEIAFPFTHPVWVRI